MSATDRARDLLAAASHVPGSEDCEPSPGPMRCLKCNGTVEAESLISRLGFTPDTLRVAAGLAAALDFERMKAWALNLMLWTDDPKMHELASLMLGQAGAQRAALAAWEKLLTQRPANGGVDEAKADRL